MRSSDEEFISSSETVLNNNESSNLSAFCTLRTDRKQKKPTPDHSSSLNFCTLRNRQDKSPDDNSFCVPYNRLKDKFSNENSFEGDNGNLIDLDDSVQPEAEAINRSLIEKYESDLCDFKPKSSQSTSNTLEKPDRKQSLKELKRLSSYCTLRPEQRRKYILRTISTLRNANKFTDEANKAISLLHELNGFNANDGCNSSATDIAACFSDPEKVEDCLLELDAYLEEIDRNYLYNDGISSEKENNFPLDKVVYVQQCKANCNNDDGGNKNSREENEKVEEIVAIDGEKDNCGYSEFLNRFSDCDNSNGVTDNCRMNDVNVHEDSHDEQSDRLSGVMNSNCTDAVKIDNEICRGHSHRNTINVPSGSTFPRSSQLSNGECCVAILIFYQGNNIFFTLLNFGIFLDPYEVLDLECLVPRL